MYSFAWPEADTHGVDKHKLIGWYELTPRQRRDGSRRKVFRRASLPPQPPVTMQGTYTNLVLMYGMHGLSVVTQGHSLWFEKCLKVYSHGQQEEITFQNG